MNQLLKRVQELERINQIGLPQYTVDLADGSKKRMNGVELVLLLIQHQCGIENVLDYSYLSGDIKSIPVCTTLQDKEHWLGK